MTIESKSFRTYKRRTVTRKSGFKVSGDTTGGQCKITKTSRHFFSSSDIVITKSLSNIQLVQLFNREISILAFGLYIKPSGDCSVDIDISYMLYGELKTFNVKSDIAKDLWNPLGAFVEIPTSDNDLVESVSLVCTISTKQLVQRQYIDLYAFNFDIVDNDYFVNNDVYDAFNSKTNLNIPYIFYFDSLECTIDSLIDYPNKNGDLIVTKSCNRCSRYLPINIENEAHTLAFSMHCKKRAPCTHSTFSRYEIKISEGVIGNIEKNYLISHFGHQLECKACKKFFVNAPLNPQRNAQQFKEDGLRRRAFEVLVNTLLDRDLVHHEFKKKTKKEFTEHIYNKFEGKCFKCGKSLNMNEMNLDHTMPLAYLYRLDETATSLCDTHNSSKNDRFPIEYYDEAELSRLGEITGLSIEKLHSREVNIQVVELLIINIVWFFDVFLMHKDYQKVRDGRLTADKIYHALCKVLPKELNLIELYNKEKGHMPSSITVE